MIFKWVLYTYSTFFIHGWIKKCEAHISSIIIRTCICGRYRSEIMYFESEVYAKAACGPRAAVCMTLYYTIWNSLQWSFSLGLKRSIVTFAAHVKRLTMKFKVNTRNAATYWKVRISSKFSIMCCERERANGKRTFLTTNKSIHNLLLFRTYVARILHTSASARILLNICNFLRR